MGYQLGVDLGTTYTAAAIHRDDRVEVARLGDRASVIPSVVYVREDGEIVVGEAANRLGLRDPERVAREFKRRMGDPTPVFVAGLRFAAHELLARVLRWVVDHVAEREGSYPDAVAVSHPANWSEYKVDLLRDAVRFAGLGAYPVSYLSEPAAAAVDYASRERVAPGAVVAVYDLGGGTFDATILRKLTDGGFELLGRPEGIEHLGGIDFDAAILGHIDQTVGGALSALDPSDTRSVMAAARLRADVVDSKEALSGDTAVVVAVVLPGIERDVRLTRAEFEAMIRPAIGETVVTVRRSLHTAGVAPEQVDAILLVGGSSRIPLVAQMLSAELHRPIGIDSHPKYAVARGAAIAAAASRQAVSGPAGDAERPADAPVAAGPPATPRAAVPPLTTGALVTGSPGRRRRSRALVAIAAAVLVVVGAIAVVAATGDDRPQSPTAAGGRSDPVGADDSSDVWVNGGIGGGVLKLDRISGEVLAHVPLVDPLGSPAVTEEAVWVLAGDQAVGPAIHRIDRESGRLLFRVALPGPERTRIHPLFPAAGGVWVILDDPDADAVTPAPESVMFLFVTDEGDVDHAGSAADVNPLGLASDGRNLFVLSRSLLQRLSPGGDAEEVSLPETGRALTFADGRLYALREDVMYELDPESGAVLETVAFRRDEVEAPIVVGAPAVTPITGVAVVGTKAALVTSGTQTQFVVLDLDTARFSSTVVPTDFGQFALKIVSHGDSYWVYATRHGRLLSIRDGEATEVGLDMDAAENAGDIAATDGYAVATGRGDGPEAVVVDADDLDVTRRLDLSLFTAAAAAAGGDEVWVVDKTNDELFRISRDDEGVADRLEFEGLLGAAEVGGYLWVVRESRAAILDLETAETLTTAVLTNLRAIVLTEEEPDRDQVWLISGTEYVRLDPETGEAMGRVPSSDYTPGASTITSSPEFATVDALWALQADGVRRIDAQMFAEVFTPLPTPGVDIFAGTDAVYISAEDGRVSRLDPATGAMTGAVDTGDEPTQVVAAGDQVWAIEMTGIRAHRLEFPAEGGPGAVVDTETLAPGLTEVAPVGDVLFVAKHGSGTIFHIDVSGDVTPLELGPLQSDMASGDDEVWVADLVGRTVYAIDAESGETVAEVPLDG